MRHLGQGMVLLLLLLLPAGMFRHVSQPAKVVRMPLAKKLAAASLAEEQEESPGEANEAVTDVAAAISDPSVQSTQLGRSIAVGCVALNMALIAVADGRPDGQNRDGKRHLLLSSD